MGSKSDLAVRQGLLILSTDVLSLQQCKVTLEVLVFLVRFHRPQIKCL